MSNKREALEAALNSLQRLDCYKEVQNQIEAALAEPEQDPVAWLVGAKQWVYFDKKRAEDEAKFSGELVQPLYTSPREWQELSEDEVIKLAVSKNLGRTLTPFGMQTGDVFVTDKSYRTYELIGFAAALSAALRAKNGG